MPKSDMLHLPSGHPVEMISPLELRVAELMHHMKIESAVAQGAKNVVKQLSGCKIQDRRTLAEVGTSWIVPIYIMKTWDQTLNCSS